MALKIKVLKVCVRDKDAFGTPNTIRGKNLGSVPKMMKYEV